MHFDTYIQSIQSNLLRGSERTHYPALKNLLDNPKDGIDAVIEEKGNKAGIPDFTVRRRQLLIGYVEAKDVGIDLNQVEKTEQLKRYRESLNGNLILTNYLEFRWYVDGKQRLKAIFAQRVGDEIQLSDSSKATELIEAFLNYTGAVINSPEDLAKQMARLTKSIRLATEEALKAETQDGELHQLKRGFNEILLPDLNDAAFADMYAQSISYGLFAARVGHAQDTGNQKFDRRTASTYIPATNPFLKRLFNTIVETDAISQINWAIDDLVQLLAQVNMSNILENFGRRIRQEDPVVHFYETFLAAYDSALRRSRGVYYTPEPVVSFIVRSVDAILKDRFNLPLGLADNTKDSVTQQPRVQILDPATGTGTFLYGVVNQIYQNLEDMGMAGSWNQYVQDNLLGRLFGFELLMAPYAIAHLKLGIQLQDLGYHLSDTQRLGIYLTNTLDEALKKSEVLFGQFVATEANEASAIKRDLPIMVVVGNPPYEAKSKNFSKRKRIVSSNERYLADIKYTGRDWNKIFKMAKKGKEITELTYIGELLERYKGRVKLEGDRNIQPLENDYIKFIRFAHQRIEQTGYGIIGFITNHSYISRVVHRGMREQILKTFDHIYVLDLHGNSSLEEKSPDGSPDENIFDIQQGVAILIAIKNKTDTQSTAFLEQVSRENTSNLATVFQYDLWGTRQYKYDFLNNLDISSVCWEEQKPELPYCFFSPKDFSLAKEYESCFKFTEIFGTVSRKDSGQRYGLGIKSNKDKLLINFSKEELENKILDLVQTNLSDEQIKIKYNLEDNDYWNTARERDKIRSSDWRSKIFVISHHVFDKRYMLFQPNLIEINRGGASKEIMRNLLEDNVAILTMKGIREENFQHFFVSESLVNKDALSSKDNCYVFPLYIYPEIESGQGNLFNNKIPNISQYFLTKIKDALGYEPSPESILYYVYAICHNPTYRQRYVEFLKIDFPRVPLTSNNELFRTLSEKGQELVELHLMKAKKLNKVITKYPVSGDNVVTEVTYKPFEQRTYINKQQYFEGIVPEVWAFKIGSYQVLDKWMA